jgi:GNAT superfamily N-acetyltransferase
VYEKDGYAIYQIDGEEYKVRLLSILYVVLLHDGTNTEVQLYAQNLSLFSKLFLETKSVFFDASTFLYYTLVLRDSSPSNNPHGQVIGFFSKEKMSWDNNNVACILVFPPWQRRGLGQILIAASYELGKREGRFGGPERPLSALGRKGYIAFWCGEVARYILNAPLKRTVTVKEISDETWILQEDVVAALKEMDVVEKRKTASGNVVVNKAKVRTWAEKNGVSSVPLVDVDAFVVEEVEREDEEG